MASNCFQRKQKTQGSLFPHIALKEMEDKENTTLHGVFNVDRDKSTIFSTSMQHIISRNYLRA
jgi:hypothetical protein